jgi:DNA (cytosine-5)-methyltransferase 1
MTHGSLFSGIGGFDLAAEWMGWENIFHCEWNPFGQKVLKHHFPNSISYNDITKTDFTIHRGNIDILTGGFPCQPYSTAGKRKGKADERHLFPEMLRVIKEIQPKWIIGENVRGLVSWGGGLVFNEVCADLEGQGYEVQPFIIPAASVNAPHRRDRIWFIAYANDKGTSSRFGQIQGKNEKISEWDNNAEFSDTDNGIITNSNNTRTNESMRNEREWEKINKKQERFSQPKFGESNGKSHAEKPDRQRQEYTLENRELEGRRFRQSNERNFWDSFPSQPPICLGSDGISTELDSITFSKWRQESTKAAGNAIVPQVAYQIFKTIKKMELNES